MAKLKLLDRVAYVRFASVYKEFRDIDHFMDIIKELKND
ncbi:MAG: transcriptional regulator NrdR, partial [Mesotoga sp.]|nr:transcriptional regulator NrdR [Mesotoga sp.]